MLLASSSLVHSLNIHPVAIEAHLAWFHLLWNSSKAWITANGYDCVIDFKMLYWSVLKHQYPASLLLWAYICYDCNDATVLLVSGNLICTSQSQETLSQATFGVVSKLGSISLGWVSEIHPEEGDLDWFVCIGTAWWQYFRMSSRSWQRLCYKQSCKEATIKGKKKHGKKMMGELMSQGTWRLPKMLCQHLPASPVFISWSFLLRQGELFL